jgi:class 3 adenylate cyclase
VSQIVGITEIKSVAMQRSLLELDSLLHRGVEILVLGEPLLAIDIFNEYLAELETRFQVEGKKEPEEDAKAKTKDKEGKNFCGKHIPIDVLTRRFKVLMLLAECRRGMEQDELALQHLIECNALARGPLAEFPEFLVESTMEISRIYVFRKEPAAAKQYVSEATRIAKSSKEPYLVSLAGFATGLLFSCVGRHSEAHSIFSGAAARLDGLNDPEHILLKADILLHMGHEQNIRENVEEAAKTYADTVRFLLECSRNSIAQSCPRDALRFLMLANRHADLLPRDDSNVQLMSSLAVTTGALLDSIGYWDKAWPCFIRALELFDSTGFAEPQLYTNAHIHLGELCIKKKDYARALTVLDRTRGRCEQADDLLGLARCLYGLGTAHSKNGDDDKGVALFEDALGVLNSLKPSKEAALLRARINNQLGFIATKLKDYEKAQTHLETSVDLLREYDSEIVMGETYRLLGEMYCQRKQHIQSERALKKSYDIFERNAARYDSARCCKSLGENYLDAGNLTMSNFFFEESIHLLEDLGIESDLPMVYSAKARISMMQQDFEAAEALFLKDYNLARKSDNVHSMAFSYYQLGKVRRLLKRTHSAEDYLRRSLGLFQNVNNQNMAAEAMLELALCASSRLDAGKAVELCSGALRIIEKSKNMDLIARHSLVRSIVLRDSRNMRQRSQSLKSFEEAVRILEKINKVSIELAEAYFEFALYWRDCRDRNRAVEYIRQAMELCEKLGLDKRAMSYLEELNRINPEEGAKMQLGRFMDKSAVASMKRLKNDDGISVERKNLTVFFTDIRSFTTISETLSLEDLTSFLNDFYAGVTQVIVKFHGQINKFIGDEVMAIFDEQPGLAPAPLRAVRAGDELTRVLNEINLRRRKRGEIDIGVGVGINTGDVIVGSFGSSMRQDYTAIGDTVNVAARLQGQAAAGEVVISEAVYQLVENFVDAEDMGEKPLKGKGQPMRLWKVHEVKEETRGVPSPVKGNK